MSFGSRIPGISISEERYMGTEGTGRKGNSRSGSSGVGTNLG